MFLVTMTSYIQNSINLRGGNKNNKPFGDDEQPKGQDLLLQKFET